MPAWTRDAEGEIAWRNGPYARAAMCPSPARTTKGAAKPFISAAPARQAAALSGRRALGGARGSAVLSGASVLSLQAVEAPTAVGSAGVAHDVSEIGGASGGYGAQRR